MSRSSLYLVLKLDSKAQSSILGENVHRLASHAESAKYLKQQAQTQVIPCLDAIPRFSSQGC